MLTNPAESLSPAMLSLDGLLAQIDRETVRDSLDLHHEPRNHEAAAGTVKHVIFILGEMLYAVPLGNVLEIQRRPKCASLPNVPDWLCGVANVRGDILSVVDLRALLGLPVLEELSEQRWIVVRSIQEEISVGLLVDRVVGIRGFAAEELKPCTAMLSGALANFVRGLVVRDNRTVAVLDVDRVLASPELRQFEADWNDE